MLVMPDTIENESEIERFLSTLTLYELFGLFKPCQPPDYKKI